MQFCHVRAYIRIKGLDIVILTLQYRKCWHHIKRQRSQFVIAYLKCVYTILVTHLDRSYIVVVCIYILYLTEAAKVKFLEFIVICVQSPELGHTHIEVGNGFHSQIIDVKVCLLCSPITDALGTLVGLLIHIIEEFFIEFAGNILL